MKKMLMMAAGLLLLTTAAAAQTANDYNSYVAVTGRAERTVTPDEIYVAITLDESTLKGSKTTLAQQEREMIARLRDLRIDVEKDLQVGDMSGDLKTYVLRKDRVQTRKSYILKLHDAPTLARVYESLGDINVADMRLMKATRSDLDAIRTELKAEAMRDARTTAETLAGAIGQSVGKAFTINDNSYYGNDAIYYDVAMPVMRAAAMTENKAVAEPAPDIEFRDMKVECSVSVRFVLE